MCALLAKQNVLLSINTHTHTPIWLVHLQLCDSLKTRYVQFVRRNSKINQNDQGWINWIMYAKCKGHIQQWTGGALFLCNLENTRPPFSCPRNSLRRTNKNWFISIRQAIVSQMKWFFSRTFCYVSHNVPDFFLSFAVDTFCHPRCWWENTRTHKPHKVHCYF